jgi:serine protease Do
LESILQDEEKTKNFMKEMIKYIASGAAGAAMLFALVSNSENANTHFAPNEPVPVKLASMNSGSAAAAGVDFTKAADLTVHAVVHIKCITNGKTFNANPSYNDPFRNFFFGGGGYQIQTPPSNSSGSGVIISDDGYICTNNHVIDNADKIEVVLNNNRTYVAEVVGKDPNTDLALIKIDEKELPYIRFGNSDDVKVGQWVLAVGNPFNLTSTATAGIISAKGRNISALENDPSKGIYPIESFLQTDAAVNPGNSGGALVNLDGELIGINAAIASATGYYTGYSFAIPVNIVRKVMSDLREFGSVQRAFLGVSIRDIDSKLSEEKDLGVSQGIYVAGLSDGGAAEASGIREGDVITKIAGAPVKSTPELQEQVSRYRPGDIIQVTIMRNRKESELAVTLRNKNGQTGIIRNVKDVVKPSSFMGASFESVSEKEKNRLRIQHGVKIIKLQSGKLASSGMREGFIITSVDKRPVDAIEDLISYLDSKKGGVLIEGVYENGVKGYYGFGM